MVATRFNVHSDTTDPVEAQVVLSNRFHRAYELEPYDDEEFRLRLYGTGWEHLMATTVTWNGRIRVDSNRMRGYRAFEVGHGTYVNQAVVNKGGITMDNRPQDGALLDNLSAIHVWVSDTVMQDVLFSQGYSSVKFQDATPIRIEGVDLYQRTVDDVRMLATSEWTGDQPVLVYEKARAMAAAMLAAFPNNRLDLYPTPGFIHRRHVSEAKAWIEGHLDRPISLTELAGMLGLSVRATQLIFERENTTFLKYLSLRRIYRARTWLTSGDQTPIGVLAARVGFSNQSRFSNAYMREFGERPTETQRRHRV